LHATTTAWDLTPRHLTLQDTTFVKSGHRAGK
jgi:hypothetical protein